MKKILILHPELVCGGAERVLIDMLRFINKSKFDITLLLRNRAEWDNQVPTGIHVKYIFEKSPYNASPWFARIYKYLQILAPRLLWLLFGVKQKFDLAIAFHEPMIWLLSVVPSKRISWVHGDYSVLQYAPEVKSMANKNGIIAKLITKKRKQIISTFDRVVFVAHSAVPSYVKANEYPLHKTKVLYNVNDIDTIFRKANEKIDNSEWLKFDGIKLCAIGRLHEQKAFHRLIPMMRLIKKKIDNVHLHIIGDGHLRSALEQEIETEGLNDYISLLGYQNNTYKFIKNASLLICSSLYEAYCTVTKESILLETPFITTDCSGMREQIGNSSAGLIVENNDTSLGDGLTSILLDNEVYKKMKRDVKLRKHDFIQESAIAKIEEFLSSL